jgi:hypothetical protein
MPTGAFSSSRVFNLPCYVLPLTFDLILTLNVFYILTIAFIVAVCYFLLNNFSLILPDLAAAACQRS